MTVPLVQRKSDVYVGADNLDTYSYPFVIAAYGELIVQTQVVATGVITDLVLDTGFTATGEGSATGGSIVLTGGNLPTGTNLLIKGDLDFDQLTDFDNQGGWHPEVHEAAFDKLTKMAQLNKDVRESHLSFPLFDGDDLNYEAPSVADRAGKVLASDALGNVTAVDVLDEDDLASDSATGLATQQSIKAYVDDSLTPTAYTGGESVTLPNGMIMKHGYKLTPISHIRKITIILM